MACRDSEIGKSLYCSREFERELVFEATALLHRLKKISLPGKGTVVDIGANMGITSVGMIHDGLVERAIAIEPDPDNMSLLRNNVRQNGLEDFGVCVPYAASDSNSTVQFELCDSNFGDHRVRFSEPVYGSEELYHESSRRVIEVEAERLDQLLKNLPKEFTEEIALIWDDVEGHEGHVFRGGEDTLARGIPVVSEIWPYGIRRANMSQEEFCNIASSFWSDYWVIRNKEFVRYPISMLRIIFDELGYEGDHTNVVFTC